MLKKLPGRSSRSKGVKVKHTLQIVLLVGVCFWLIYQVKRSHDKKKEFDQKDNELTIKTQDGRDLLKFGRKDLHPHVEEVHPDSKQEEDEEEDSKHEVEEGREELKNEAVDEDDEGSKHEEETDDDGRGGGDDDINENDQEKADNEPDHEGENAGDERLKEDGDEEAEGNEESDKEDQREDENSSDEQENDGDDPIAHEAREENYKGDDASSAVAHDDHSTTSETEEENLENSSENSELNNKEQNSESSDIEAIHSRSRLTEEVDKMVNSETSNENFSDVKLDENTSLPTDGSVQESILTTRSHDHPESSNKTSSATTQSLILTNLNDKVLENSTSESQPNSISKDENSNGVEGEAGLTVSDEKTTEPENVLPTMIPQENSEATQNNKLEENGESNSDSSDSTNDIEDRGQDDPFNPNDSHVTERVDLDTLPDIRTEVDNSEETGAE